MSQDINFRIAASQDSAFIHQALKDMVIGDCKNPDRGIIFSMRSAIKI